MWTLLICSLTSARSGFAQLPEQWPARSYSQTSSPTTNPPSPESNSDDQTIARTLRQRLEADPGVHSYEIAISVRDGTVTLSGMVNNLLARQRAVELARTLPGVSSVRDQIEVSLSEKSDSEIQDEVARVLRGAPAIQQDDISTAVQDGFVTLSGTVNSWEQRGLAGLLTKGVPGVRGVENKLRVSLDTQRTDGEIEEDILSRIQWDVQLQDPPVKVSVENGVVRLTGFVNSGVAKERLVQDAWVMGVKSVDSTGVQVVSNVPEAMEHAAGQ